MAMGKEEAREIVDKLLRFTGKLDGSLAEIQGVVDEELYLQYRARVGQAMGVVYIEVLREIFRLYPDLEPESMRA